jgi:hypothetical protein
MLFALFGLDPVLLSLHPAAPNLRFQRRSPDFENQPIWLCQRKTLGREGSDPAFAILVVARTKTAN